MRKFAIEILRLWKDVRTPGTFIARHHYGQGLNVVCRLI